MTKDEKVIKDIISRYGETINLKKQPHLILEIIRQFGPRVSGKPVAECLPPGGPPSKVDVPELINLMKLKVSELTKISTALEKAIRNKNSAK